MNLFYIGIADIGAATQLMPELRNNTLTLLGGAKKCFRTINERYIKNVCIKNTIQ